MTPFLILNRNYRLYPGLQDTFSSLVITQKQYVSTEKQFYHINQLLYGQRNDNIVNRHKLFFSWALCLVGTSQSSHGNHVGDHWCSCWCNVNVMSCRGYVEVWRTQTEWRPLRRPDRAATPQSLQRCEWNKNFYQPDPHYFLEMTAEVYENVSLTWRFFSRLIIWQHTRHVTAHEYEWGDVIFHDWG